MNSCTPESDVCDSQNKPGGNHLILPLCIGLIFLLLPLIVQTLDAHSYFLKISNLIGSIQDRACGPPLAMLVYLVAGGLFISMGVPRLWISAGAGAVFNPWLGTAVALGASLVGAATLFQVGRRFLSPGRWDFLENRLGRYRYAFQQRAFLCILYARLFPLSNSTIVSLFSGYCKIGFMPYLTGSLIGFTPLTIIMCLFGSGATHGNGRIFHFLLGFILITMLHLLTLFFKKFLPTTASQDSTRSNDDH